MARYEKARNRGLFYGVRAGGVRRPRPPVDGFFCNEDLLYFFFCFRMLAP